ncbi:MAG TPA: class II fructose-bisphosphate aldolase [Alphaproteobacteria bacterium]
MAMPAFKSGFVFGNEAWDILEAAKQANAALPAVNVTGTNTINATLEAAAAVNSPVIVQFSHGGATFYAGKSLSNDDHQAAIKGAISGALHIHNVAEAYGVPVIIHTDHAAMNLLPWIDGLLSAGSEYKKATGKPLFSSHMLDFSEEPLHENLETSARYFKTMTELEMMLEIELGVTGGEEDGVDNTNVDSSRLYTQPSEVLEAYNALSAVGKHFTIAAAFGNVHGVYSPGNVKLTPSILKNSQDHVRAELKLKDEKPVSFVFHGGSGSSRDEIHEALSYGAVKMNLDTDLQWAFWDGVRAYEAGKRDYLQGQIGNPEGAEKPNKKFYDPRVWLRDGEKAFVKRLMKAFDDLNAIGLNGR